VLTISDAQVAVWQALLLRRDRDALAYAWGVLSTNALLAADAHKACADATCQQCRYLENMLELIEAVNQLGLYRTAPVEQARGGQEEPKTDK
jgi:hypothetical protein